MIGTGSEAYTYMGLTVNKADAASIFAVSDGVKSEVEKILHTEMFQDF